MADKYKVEKYMAKKAPHVEYYKVYKKEDSESKSFVTHIATFYDEEEVKEYGRFLERRLNADYLGVDWDT